MCQTGALALTGIFGKKFVKTRTLYPPGVFTILGLLSLAYHGSKAYEWNPYTAEE